MKIVKTSDGLLAPQSYLDASEEEIQRVNNYCGPDGFFNELVPNHLLDLDIRKICSLHDWTFEQSKNLEDHKQSDALFLKNLKSEIRKKSSSPILKYMRYGLAYIYFGVVRIYSTLLSKSTHGQKFMALK